MDRATFIGFILFVMESGIVEDNDDLKATKRATISCDSNKICGCGGKTRTYDLRVMSNSL